MAGFNESPKFFTLTDLTRLWTEATADNDTLRNRRRTVRKNTIGRGCPHVKLGDETLFVTNSFVQWLLDNEETTDPESE